MLEEVISTARDSVALGWSIFAFTAEHGPYISINVVTIICIVMGTTVATTLATLIVWTSFNIVYNFVIRMGKIVVYIALAASIVYGTYAYVPLLVAPPPPPPPACAGWTCVWKSFGIILA